MSKSFELSLQISSSELPTVGISGKALSFTGNVFYSHFYYPFSHLDLAVIQSVFLKILPFLELFLLAFRFSVSLNSFCVLV